MLRMVDASVRAAAENPLRPSRLPRHPDYDKIAGEFARPSTSIVFGEKGSGKTAIRMQMGTSAATHNALNPQRRVLLVVHDDLSGPLSRLHERVRTVRKGKESPTIDSLRKMRLVDHVDALLAAIVPGVVDAMLEFSASGIGGIGGSASAGTSAGSTLGPAMGVAVGGGGSASAERIDLLVPWAQQEGGVRKSLRRLDRNLKRDVLLLQASYDRPDAGGERTRQLRKALGIRTPLSVTVENVLAYGGWLLPLTVFVMLWRSGAGVQDPVAVTAFFVAMGVWLAGLLKRAVTERLGIRTRARRLWRQLRTVGRSEGSFVRSIRELPPGWRPSTLLPTSESEEVRLAMLSRLVRVVRAYGYEHIVVVIDRVDEPPIIQGDPERMKAVVWPLLSNRFLQQEGIAFKLLLPIDLRHQLARESSAFFQDARLDKQSMIEALSWSGVALYDLATQRLGACRPAEAGVPTVMASDGAAVASEHGASGFTLQHLFAPEVSREHLLDALEQMRQPRDAFKLLYQCIADHCSATVLDASEVDGVRHASGQADAVPAAAQISRATLDAARKAQVERIRQVAMGVRAG